MHEVVEIRPFSIGVLDSFCSGSSAIGSSFSTTILVRMLVGLGVAYSLPSNLQEHLSLKQINETPPKYQ
jgi:hypothetical protein